MYREAYPLVRSVCWLAVNNDDRCSGQMFLISDRLAVTAKHVLDSGAVMLARWDGLWATEVLMADDEADLAVVKLAKHVKPNPFEKWQAPAAYPRIGTDPLMLGDDVAVVGSMHRRIPGEIELNSHTVLSRGIVSFLSMKPTRLAIHGAFVEPGFSGGPVFRANGDLIGVVTGVTSTRSRSDLAATIEFPLASPLHKFGPAMEELLRTNR